jgi:hypothetical protein
MAGMHSFIIYSPRAVRAALSALAAGLVLLVSGCGGGGSSSATVVELCIADMRPRLLACMGSAYDGKNTTAFSACVRSNPDLMEAVWGCRAQGADEFRAVTPMTLGSAAAAVLEAL